MKKVVLLAVLLLMFLCAETVFADETTTSDGFVFQKSTGTIINYTGEDDEIVIPASIDGVNVLALGDNAFKNKDLASVTIENGVCVIGESCFKSNSLESVSLPNSIIYIGASAFADNEDFSSFRLPTPPSQLFMHWADQDGHVYMAGTNVSNLSTSFEAVIHYTLADNDVVVSNGVLQSYDPQTGFVNPRYIIIPENLDGQHIKEIGSNAFKSKSLKYVSLPDGITKIHSNAFAQNNLTEFALPDGLSYIGESAFSNNNIKELNFPESLVSIGVNAFAHNDLNRTSPIVLSRSIRYIGHNAFHKNNADYMSVLPEIIDDDFLYWISDTGKKYIGGQSVNLVGDNSHASGYTAVYDYTLTDDDVTVVDGVITEYSFCNHGYKGGNVPMSFTIPSTLDGQTVTEIADCVFKNKNIVSVTLPDTIEKIGSQAFKSNPMKNILLPNSVVYIGSYAFAESGIESFMLPTPSNPSFNHWTDSDDNTYPGDSTVTNLNTAYTAYFPSQVNIAEQNLLLELSEQYTINATITSNGPNTPAIVYSSSDESIATVSQTGLITADSANTGTVTITAAASDNSSFDTCEVKVVAVKTTGVQITPQSAHICIGDTVSLSCEFIPENSTIKDVIYESSNEAIATVSASGVVTAISLGDVEIKAYSKGGAGEDTCTIKVGPNVSSVSIQDAQVSIGQTIKLNPIVSPADAVNKKVIFSIDNSNVATIDAHGNLTGVSLGTATVTVTTVDGNLVDTCTIKSGTFVQSVAISPKTWNMKTGETKKLDFSITPQNATNKAVSYSSSNPTVATVDAIGIIWAYTAGSATITVTTQDGSHTDTCTVTVVQAATGVELSQQSTRIVKEDTFQLYATVKPSNAANKNVVFSSANNAIATVSSTGLITAHTIGRTTITVTTQDGCYTDTCEVFVTPELIEAGSLTVNRDKSYLEDIAIGATVQDIIGAVSSSNGQVRIFDSQMQEIEVGNNVSTGYVVQLIVEGEVADQLSIVIEGDTSPDGILDIIDYTVIRLHILDVTSQKGIILDAADVNDDGIIDVVDYVLVRLHILDVSSLYQ